MVNARRFVSQEEFLGAILGKPDPLGTAAFVAAITGECDVESAAVVILREFDPDEPRDSWGRWTTGGDSASGSSLSPAEVGASKHAGASSRSQRRLTWDDFKEVDVLPPDSGGGESAFVRIKWDPRCRPTGSVSRGPDGVYSAEVTTKIAKIERTYEGSVLKGDKTDDLLAHENGHVKISEDAATAAEHEIEGVVGSARANDSATARLEAGRDWSRKVDKVITEHKAAMDAAQKKYDRETDHGRK